MDKEPFMQAIETDDGAGVNVIVGMVAAYFPIASIEQVKFLVENANRLHEAALYNKSEEK